MAGIRDFYIYRQNKRLIAYLLATERPTDPPGADELFIIPISRDGRPPRRKTRRVDLRDDERPQVADWLADIVNG